MRLGLIQTRGLGDIVIAAPIAQYYVDQGHEVYWPVDHFFYPSVKAAFPEIGFLQLEPELSQGAGRNYFLDRPLEILRTLACDPIVPLYSYLSGLPVTNSALARSLKFDEYKYAVCNVPFSFKWKLKIKRNMQRENSLFESLHVSEPFVLAHNRGSNVLVELPLQEQTRKTRVVYIDERTNNPFDWLMTIELASEVHFIDSVFANIVEQLKLNNSAFLYLRSQVGFTPVFQHLHVTKYELV